MTIEKSISTFEKVLLNFFNVLTIGIPLMYASSFGVLMVFFVFIGLFFIENKNIHKGITIINVLILVFLGFTMDPAFGWGALLLGILGVVVLTNKSPIKEKTSWECTNCTKILKNEEIRFGLCTFCGAKMNRSRF